MQLTNIINLALLIAYQTSASPIWESGASSPNAGVKLNKRAAIKPVSCGPSTDTRAWPLQSVQDAYDELVRLTSAQQTVSAGTRKYPGKYGKNKNIPTDAAVVSALNAIPECVTGQTDKEYREFPITSPTFNGGAPGSQGADRVVAIVNTTTTPPSSIVYCLAMTHRGVPNNGFVPCT